MKIEYFFTIIKRMNFVWFVDENIRFKGNETKHSSTIIGLERSLMKKEINKLQKPQENLLKT